jgi:hypothetical protein
MRIWISLGLLALGWLPPARGVAVENTYRIGSRTLSEAELRAQYERVKDRYVIVRDTVTTTNAAAAFPARLKVLRFIDDYTVLVQMPRPGDPAAAAVQVVASGGYYGQRQSLPEDAVQANSAGVVTGGTFIVRARFKAIDMPLSETWDVYLTDARTLVERKRSDGSRVKLPVYYDVTLTFKDFIKLLQRGYVFRELSQSTENK